MMKVKVYGQDRYIPISKALKWLGKHIAESTGSGEFPVRTPKLTIYVPVEVVLTRSYYPKRISWSKRNILHRDKFTCAYCGISSTEENPVKMTVDHVIPKIHFRDTLQNPNTWKNTVCCCKKCNTRKGGRTPEQAGMRFRHGYMPYDPNHK
jgi:5-methylcytosine-specific restriction endonuclease McrA